MNIPTNTEIPTSNVDFSGLKPSSSETCGTTSNPTNKKGAIAMIFEISPNEKW